MGQRNTTEENKKEEPLISDQPILNNNEVNSICKHDDFKIVNTNPEADGIETDRTFDAICKSCDKLLATRHECISADWEDVYDQEWMDKHDYLKTKP